MAVTYIRTRSNFALPSQLNDLAKQGVQQPDKILMVIICHRRHHIHSVPNFIELVEAKSSPPCDHALFGISVVDEHWQGMFRSHERLGHRYVGGQFTCWMSLEQPKYSWN